MKHLVFLLCGAVLGLSGCASAPGSSDEPLPINARYNPVVVQMEGWTVYVEPALLPGGAHEDVGTPALEMLENHLQRIAVLMNEPQLSAMRTRPIWIEVDNPLTDIEPGPYHPGRQWLIDNGYDPRLENCVHVTRAASLLDRHHMLKHPMVILHELVHAYHDEVLEDAYQNTRVLEAYNQAMEEGLYDEVRYYRGNTVRAYAATNQMEYLAELTEAYFYRNDFYPFLATELAEHDPRGYALMVEIWGPLEGLPQPQ